jgi:hypothetical protein
LHSQLQKLETGEVSRKEVAERAISFVENLCQWWIVNSYGFYGGSCPLENTIVVTDANQTGWSGCIFKLIEIETDENFKRSILPFSLIRVTFSK